MKVNIPFLPEFKDAMLSGRKRATARTKRYGWPGDIFTAFGVQFELTWVVKVPLSLVETNWATEGCASRMHFIEVWRRGSVSV